MQWCAYLIIWSTYYSSKKAHSSRWQSPSEHLTWKTWPVVKDKFLHPGVAPSVVSKVGHPACCLAGYPRCPSISPIHRPHWRFGEAIFFDKPIRGRELQIVHRSTCSTAQHSLVCYWCAIKQLRRHMLRLRQLHPTIDHRPLCRWLPPTMYSVTMRHAAEQIVPLHTTASDDVKY